MPAMAEKENHCSLSFFYEAPKQYADSVGNDCKQRNGEECEHVALSDNAEDGYSDNQKKACLCYSDEAEV